MSRFNESKGFDPFEDTTRFDLWELTQEVAPFDVEAVVQMRRDAVQSAPRRATPSSRRLRRESGRLTSTL